MKIKKKAHLSNTTEYIEHKRKKKWIDEKFSCNCFTLYPRSLFVTWGTRVEYWDWKCFKETSDENVEVAKLNAVCWLDVRGKFNMSELSPGIVYEVIYVIKLTNGASGWELPIVLRLSLPGKLQERQVSLLEKPKGEWLELNVGNFQTQDCENGEVCFDLYEHGGHWKRGLIIQCAIIRPKASTNP
ncbi:hypothetical protein CsSME_00011959 [Camellia sinensis var. sinensis]